MRDFMNITRALSDENRVRILMALRDHELCVCQIIALLDLAPSTISKHLSILHQARLIEKRKAGRWIYYRLCDATSCPACSDALRWVCNALVDEPIILSDAAALKKINTMEPEELCKTL